MKKRTIVALAGIATMLAACTNDDIYQPDNANRTPLELTAGIATRATDGTWNRADAIGVFTLAIGTNTIAQGVNNFKYTNTADDGAEAIFSPADEENTAYYPINGDRVDVLAYYPHSAANSQLSTLNFQLPVSVANQSSLPAIDLMTAERVTGKHYDDPEVALEFVHRLTKLNVILAKADEASEIDLTGARITLVGMPTTAVYNLVEQEFKSFGAKANIELASGGTGIVIPTAAGSGVNFIIEAAGKTFNAALPAGIAFATGEEVTLTIRLRTFTEATVTATIRPWTGGPTAGLEAVHFTLPNHPETGTPEVTTFTLYKNRGTTGAASVDYTYNAGTKAWDTSSAPFYIEDIAAEDKFVAVHTPTTEDPITGVKDVLETAEAEMDGDGVIGLAFGHINAQLTVNLQKDASVKDIDLSKAKTKILGYSLTGAGNTLTVEPTNIAAGDITLTVDGKEFAVSGNAITLAAGTQNTLNITLTIKQDGNAVAGIEAKITPWEAKPAEALTALHLVIPTNPVTGDPEVNTFTLYKNKGAAGEVSVNYVYNAGTKVWETPGGLPFYVEDITGADTFTAVHTPQVADAITGVKDIMETGAATMDGNKIINLTFAHINAKVSIVLKPGENFPNAAKLETASITFGGHTFTGEQILLIVPTTIAIGTLAATITVDDNVYEVMATKDIVLAKGTQTVLTFTLKPTAAGMNVGIADWGEEVKSGLDAQVDITSGGDFSKLPSAGTVNISTGNIDGEYRWTGAAIVVVKPVYWNQLSADTSHNFAMEFTPDDAGTPEKNVLAATVADVVWGTSINFAVLTHKYAEFTVVLKKGTGYIDNAEFDAAVATATINLMGFSTTVPDYSTAPGVASIVKPQTLTDNHRVIVAIGGNTYGMTMPGIFAGDKLDGNKRYTLEATVNKSGTSISIGQVEDWVDGGTGTGELER